MIGLVIWLSITAATTLAVLRRGAARPQFPRLRTVHDAEQDGAEPYGIGGGSDFLVYHKDASA